MKKDPRVYLAQILERIDRILEYTSEGKAAFSPTGGLKTLLFGISKLSVKLQSGYPAITGKIIH